MLNNTTLQKEYFKTWMFKQGLSITLYDYLQDTLCSALEEGRHGLLGNSKSTVRRTLTSNEVNSKEFKILIQNLTNCEYIIKDNVITFYFNNPKLF